MKKSLYLTFYQPPFFERMRKPESFFGRKFEREKKKSYLFTSVLTAHVGSLVHDMLPTFGHLDLVPNNLMFGNLQFEKAFVNQRTRVLFFFEPFWHFFFVIFFFSKKVLPSTSVCYSARELYSSPSATHHPPTWPRPQQLEGRKIAVRNNGHKLTNSRRFLFLLFSDRQTIVFYW